MAEWTRKAPLPVISKNKNSIEPICKHTKQKSRHTALERALVYLVVSHSCTWHTHAFYGKIEVMFCKSCVHFMVCTHMRNDIKGTIVADRFYRPIILGETNRNLDFWIFGWRKVILTYPFKCHGWKWSNKDKIWHFSQLMLQKYAWIQIIITFVQPHKWIGELHFVNTAVLFNLSVCSFLRKLLEWGSTGIYGHNSSFYIFHI